MEEILQENSRKIAALWREMRNFTEQQESYRKKQITKLRDRQDFEKRSADELRDKMRNDDNELEQQIQEMRDELETQIKIMTDNVHKTKEEHCAALREVEETMQDDELATIRQIEDYNSQLALKKMQAKKKIDELNETAMRLVDSPEDENHRASPQVALEKAPESPRDQQQSEPEPHPEETSQEAPEVQEDTKRKRTASHDLSESENDLRKKQRHESAPATTNAAEFPENNIQITTPVEHVQASPDKESPNPVPKSSQSAPKPKGLILAPWQRDRLVNYEDIQGKEYVYVRHNVARVLRCPDCPGFETWPRPPTIRGDDKAHFINSEVHRQQRAADGDLGPGRGREEGGGGITSDWITRNFGWRVVTGVPKGSLEEWASCHNEEVDRSRHGQVISDIVFEPSEEVYAMQIDPQTPTQPPRKRAKSARSRSSISTVESMTPAATTANSEVQSPERKVAGSPESTTRSAAREGGYSMRNIARRNYTIPSMDDIRDKGN
ncbi:hypothetical protein MKZ38_003026 [Zalerion maritima]|uniref:Uncharacterized protein n=1 Tax=Zalerion maritima TaxID=339359 RepID=A0AAD5WS13_9PEZI|nr:hypothetical protein MKZ38_003026 [Zalerion maritima]